MNIENKFSIIRKAIQGRAEKKSDENSLSKPEQRHYDESFSFYKTMRIKRPEKMKNLILMYAERKDLRNKMGTELFKVFNQTWSELTKDFFFEMIQKANDFFENYFQKNQNLPRSEFVKKMEDLSEEILKLKAEILRNDPRIISAFSGKEEILSQVIDYAISTTIFEARNSYYFS
jgi:hypothetical protein